MFNNTLIVGLGLIGGSLAFDIKSQKLSNKIYAFDTNKDILTNAIQLGVIDDEFDKNTRYDFVIFANPISSLKNSANYLKDYVKNAIITDVASVKVYIEDIFKKIFDKYYVGSHPIAGSHKRGFESAKEGLFKDRLSIICQSDVSDKDFINIVKDFWEAIGSKTILMDAKTHDEIFGLTSHLPHLVAFSLSSLIDKDNRNFLGQGFLDTTRIGASDPRLWTDVFLYNKDNVLKALEDFTKSLDTIKNLIKNEDKEKLFELLKEISNKRRNL